MYCLLEVGWTSTRISYRAHVPSFTMYWIRCLYKETFISLDIDLLICFVNMLIDKIEMSCYADINLTD